MKKKKFIVVLVILVVLVAIRVALPPVMVRFANNYLKDFSSIVSAHIQDIDLAILRGAFQADEVTVTLKKTDKEILSVRMSEFSIAWSELLKGKLMANVVVEKADLIYSEAILTELKKLAKPDAKDKKEFAPPLDLERLEFRKASVTLEDYPGFKAGQKLKLQEINSKITNLTPKNEYPYTFYLLTASIQGATPFKAAGKVNLLAKPIEWDLDASLRSFNLTTANPLLKKKVPLTFTNGTLDMYAEASSDNGKIEGYIKPFLKNLDILKTDEDFKSTKHWAIEIITAMTNILIKDKSLNSMATRVPFQYKNSVKVDTGEALEKAIQHGHEENLKPGIENKYDIE